MPLQVSITKVIADGQNLRVAFNLIKSGLYVTAKGGDAIDFTAAVQDPSFVGMVAYVPSDQGPLSYDVWDVSGNLANTYVPTMGTTQKNSKVQILSAYNTELGSGAYPAVMQLIGEAVFNKNI